MGRNVDIFSGNTNLQSNNNESSYVSSLRHNIKANDSLRQSRTWRSVADLHADTEAAKSKSRYGEHERSAPQAAARFQNISQKKHAVHEGKLKPYELAATL
jgi:hypothetical protein